MRILASILLSLVYINAYADRYTTVTEQNKSGAMQGDAKAQLLLGIQYQFGYGVERDPVAAVSFYTSSAMKRNADALFNLGACFEDGVGVEKNLIEAFAYYSLAKTYNRTSGVDERLAELKDKMSTSEIVKAAIRSRELYYIINPDEKEAEIKRQKQEEVKRQKEEVKRQEAVAEEKARQLDIIKVKAGQGDPDAEFKMGCLYATGEEVRFPKDIYESADWFQKAAMQGHAEAQYRLGLCCYTGNGTPKDILQSYALFDISGNYFQKARVELSKIQKDMTDAQIKAGQKRSRELQKEIEANIAAKKTGK